MAACLDCLFMAAPHRKPLFCPSQRLRTHIRCRSQTVFRRNGRAVRSSGTHAARAVPETFRPDIVRLPTSHDRPGTGNGNSLLFLKFVFGLEKPAFRRIDILPRVVVFVVAGVFSADAKRLFVHTLNDTRKGFLILPFHVHAHKTLHLTNSFLKKGTADQECHRPCRGIGNQCPIEFWRGKVITIRTKYKKNGQKKKTNNKSIQEHVQTQAVRRQPNRNRSAADRLACRFAAGAADRSGREKEVTVGIFPRRLGKNPWSCRPHFVSLQREH